MAWTGVRWAGVTILLLAYILVSQGFVDGKGLVFNATNCLGSILMIINSLSIRPRDWAVTVFNMVWVGISLFTISRLFI